MHWPPAGTRGWLRATAWFDDTAAVRRRDRTVLWGVGAAAVAAIVGSIFAWLGMVNGDEGWYVICARLVSEGRLPYHDFAFTQGPIYLYALAPFVRVVPDLYTARAVSVVCSAAAVGLLIAVARRVGGKWGAVAASAALLATIPSLPYWLSITKTYALSCLFLAAILFTLTSAARPEVRYPLSAALAVGFTETRTTGVALAVLLIAVLVKRSPDGKTRKRVWLATAVMIVPFAALVILSWARARWGLFDYHQLGATGASGIGRFWSRTFAAAHAWPGPFVLGAAATLVAVLDSDMRARIKRRPDLAAYAAGIVLFVLMHEAGGAFFAEEYLAPVIAPLVVVSAVILVRAATRPTAGARSRESVAVRALLIVGIAVTAITGGHRFYLGAPGWSGDPAGISALANCVQKYSAPSDTVFALSFEEVVVQAHRHPEPDVTLGQFSYENVTRKRAHELRILNHSTLDDVFTRPRPPKVLVLTAEDIFETQRAGFFSKQRVTNLGFYNAFQDYKPVCTVTVLRHIFVNYPVKVTVYARKAAAP
jgi:hypothetical protein